MAYTPRGIKLYGGGYEKVLVGGGVDFWGVAGLEFYPMGEVGDSVPGGTLGVPGRTTLASGGEFLPNFPSGQRRAPPFR